MKLQSIETTPSPNCMKLNLDAVASEKPLTLNAGSETVAAPEIFQKLLNIEGIQSVFVMNDFITLTRRGNTDWQPILATAGTLIGIAEAADASVNNNLQPNSTEKENKPNQDFGQVDVAIQMFRGIPVQVRVTTGEQQARVALPDRFNQALQRAISQTQANYVAERIWSPYQPQFGSPDAIAQQVADELDILINDQDLTALEAAAISPEQKTPHKTPSHSQQTLLSELQHPDWKRRLKAIQHIEVDYETFSAITTALQDDRNAIRRWAAALLGASENSAAVQPLCQVLLHDKSAIVRRTAGDALSDLGDVKATDAMVTALQDASGLVRWRAGRFLNELGTDTAVAALTQAAEVESEFDVRVEMNAAIDRIQAGKASQLPMWMRISQGE
ncbi:MAG: virulence factor [Cyanobacteria bacterium P01_F01_bin.53]